MVGRTRSLGRSIGAAGLAVLLTGLLGASNVAWNAAPAAAAVGDIATISGGHPIPGGPYDNGDGGAAAAAILASPTDIARIGRRLYVTEFLANRVRQIDLTTNVITTLAGTGDMGSAGDGGPASLAQLSAPTALAPDGAGGLLVAGVDARIRRIDLGTGNITTIAGTGVGGYTGDGGPALAAQFSNSIVSLAVSRDGKILVSDAGNAVVRCIGCIPGQPNSITTAIGDGTAGPSPDGTVGTAAGVGQVYRAIWANDGSIIYSETMHARVRRVDPVTHIITTLVGTGTVVSSGDGGQSNAAGVMLPIGLRFAADGSLIVVDSMANTIRHVAPPLDGTGVITSIAGNGTDGYSGDGTSAVSAQLHTPTNVVTDDGTHLYIVDFNNNAIRRVEGSKPELTTTLVVPNSLKIGKRTLMRVQIRNRGSGWATGPISATLTVRKGLTMLSVSGTGWSCATAQRQARCRLDRNLAPNAVRTLRVRVRADGQAVGRIRVQARSISDSDDANPMAGLASSRVRVR
ncbi:MAG: hypothetical protein ACOYNI_11450 [Acidimicrobiia bacterium]